MKRRRAAQAAETQPIVDALWCSFCGAAEAEVHKMIAGDRAQICDRCVREAVALVLRRATDPTTRAASASLDASTVLCGFCHSSSLHRSVMVGNDSVVICEQCLAGILVAVAEELSLNQNRTIMLSLPSARARADDDGDGGGGEPAAN